MPRQRARLELEDVLHDLWSRGIPVVPLERLPRPSFQAMACIVERRPVVLLSHKHDEPARVAFLIAHEVGHIVANHCAPEQPVIDGDDEVADHTSIEARADAYAISVLGGSSTVPSPPGGDFKVAARRAAEFEQETGVDAGFVIFRWASIDRDYSRATRAIRALYRESGARRAVREHIAKHLSIETSSETDRALLRCVYSGSDDDARRS